MKNLSLILNGVLLVAVIVLFILHFTSKKESPDVAPVLSFENDTTVTLPIAYVNVDTLLTHYTYAKEITELLMAKTESTQATLNQRERALMQEQQEFQRKFQNNAFISQERAEQEYSRIQKLAADYEQTVHRLQSDFAMEQIKYNNQISDSVRICLEEFNKTANYHIIFGNSGLSNVLFAKPRYDVTSKVLNLLNSRYIPEKK